MAARRVPSTLCPKKWTTQLLVITLSKLNRFSKFFHPRKEEQSVNKTHTRYPTTPKVCCHTTCGKSKFKFAASCATDGRLVELLWCPSASQSLASGTSSLSIRGWRSTAAITKLSSSVEWSTFETQCSFVDEIELNYSLAAHYYIYMHC